MENLAQSNWWCFWFDYDFIDFGKTIKGVVNINGALGDKSYLDNNRTPFLSVHNIYDPEIPFNRGNHIIFLS
jgi:hypothetical protein